MLAGLINDENRKWWTLGAVSIGLFMIMLDNTIVNVALPTMERDLHIKVTELQWIVAAYTLSFASLIITGGKLADMFGRRRVFNIGLAIFTLASLGCGLSGSAHMLIAFRAIQGGGAAIMNPATLSIVTATFPPRQRGTAIGIWAGTAATALGIGPLLGGVLTEQLNWNWIFFVNVPIGVLAILFSRIAVLETRDSSREQRLDVPGLLSSGTALFTLTFALIESDTYGWRSPLIYALFAVSAVAFVVFILLELRQRLPMLELSLFRARNFVGANVVVLLVTLAMFGVLFFVSLYLQNVLRYSPTQAGASFLPMTFLIMLIAPIAGRTSDRIGSRWLMAGGMSLVSLSLFLYSRLTVNSSYSSLVIPMVLGGIGMATAMSPTTAAAMTSVPAAKAGVGSAVLNSFRQVGGSLGIALLGAIFTTGVRSARSAGQPPSLAFMHGFTTALHVAAAIALGAAIFAALIIRPRQPAPDEEPASASSTVAADTT
ncbi:MAG: DHA2 family efflux MFS transporter permease subunit [Gaiellaceae bacterium]